MTTIQLNEDYSLVKGPSIPYGKYKVVSSLFRFMAEKELEKYVTGSREKGFTDYVNGIRLNAEGLPLRGLNSSKDSFASALKASGIKDIDAESFTIFTSVKPVVDFFNKKQR